MLYSLVDNLYGVLALVAGQALANNAPGHAANGLIAHLFTVYDATDGTLNEQILLQEREREKDIENDVFACLRKRWHNKRKFS